MRVWDYSDKTIDAQFTLKFGGIIECDVKEYISDLPADLLKELEREHKDDIDELQLDELPLQYRTNITMKGINTRVFNTMMSEDKNTPGRSGNEVARIIYTKRDNFESPAHPIDVIKANRPIIILDEPQKMGGVAAQTALKKNFSPLFSPNYSAIHKTSYNLVYVLYALDAFKNKLTQED